MCSELWQTQPTAHSTTMSRATTAENNGGTSSPPWSTRARSPTTLPLDPMLLPGGGSGGLPGGGDGWQITALLKHHNSTPSGLVCSYELGFHAAFSLVWIRLSQAAAPQRKAGCVGGYAELWRSGNYVSCGATNTYLHVYKSFCCCHRGN